MHWPIFIPLTRKALRPFRCVESLAACAAVVSPCWVHIAPLPVIVSQFCMLILLSLVALSVLRCHCILFGVGLGSWHCHRHRAGLSDVLGQGPCGRLCWLACNCSSAGDTQCCFPSSGNLVCAHTRQKACKSFLETSGGHQQGCLLSNKSCCFTV